MKGIFTTSIFLFVSIITWGQQVSINRIEVLGDEINLYYDLFDDTPHRTYTVSMYSSKDNFISTLEKVTGDVGLEVKPGGNKKITWNSKEELGADFDGKMSLEIRGKIYIPFVRLDGLNKNFKRDKPYELTWTGGTQQNILNFELYRGDDKITTFPNIANVGHYTITIPVSIKPGKNYRLKITDTRNKDQVVYSQPFAVSRKIPLALKVFPLILVGTGVYSLASGSKGPGDIPDPIVASITSQ